MSVSRKCFNHAILLTLAKLNALIVYKSTYNYSYGYKLMQLFLNYFMFCMNPYLESF